MMMGDKPSIIAVVGATGTQGGSVVNALLQSFPASSSSAVRIRCLTRNPKSKKSQELMARSNGRIEMIQADLSNPASLEAAFRDVFAVFGVTNYWDPETGPKEYDQGKNMADAAKKCQVRYFIWSSLENAEKRSGGKFKVPHFTYKAKVSDYMKEIGLPLIIVQPGHYISNIRDYFPPERMSTATNGYEVQLSLKPNTLIPFFDPTDMGFIVAGILQSPEQYLGLEIPCYSEFITFPQACTELGKALKTSIHFKSIPKTDPKSQALGKDFIEMLEFFDEFGYFHHGATNAVCKKLYPRMNTIQDWVTRHHYSL